MPSAAARPAGLDRDTRGGRDQNVFTAEQVKPSEAHRCSPVTLVDKFSLRKLVFEVGVGSKPRPILKANASSEKMFC